MASTSKMSKSSKKSMLKVCDAQTELTAIAEAPVSERLTALTNFFIQLTSSAEQLAGAVASAERGNSSLRSETAAALLSQGQLETRCRELQRVNRRAKEEGAKLVAEEEQKREDVNSRLSSTMDDINGLMKQNDDKNTQIREDNKRMEAKLADLSEQYEARKQHMAALVKQRELHRQLSEAKMAKANLEASQQRETCLREKKKLIKMVQSYQHKLSELTDSEANLRSQLLKFSSQYEQFQDTVSSSNTIMTNFESELESMSAKIQQLEKESLQWQGKWQHSNCALMHLITERTEYVMKCDRLSKQNLDVQAVARQVQGELTSRRKARGASKQTAQMTATVHHPASGARDGSETQGVKLSTDSQMSAIQARLDSLKLSVESAGEIGKPDKTTKTATGVQMTEL